jgi:hypothetical protein
MAMNEINLSSSIMNELKSSGFKESTSNLALANAISKSVIAEIKNADIEITQAVISVSGGSGAPAVGVIAPFKENGKIS